MQKHYWCRQALILLLALMIMSSLLGTACQREAVKPPVDPPPTRGPADPPQEPVAPVEPTPQNEPLIYTLRVRSLTVRDLDGSVLAKARCTVPEIVDDSEHAGISAINEQLASEQQFFLDWVEENALEVAREDRAGRQADFIPHEYERWSDVQYNYNGIFSVLTEDYFDGGGAHPGAFMLVDNFVVETGMRLTLAEVWGLDNEAALDAIYGIVARQIETQRGTDSFGYYEDYADLLAEVFDPEDFVIAPEGLIVFYQPYTISPYAAGIPQFVIPFEQRPEAAMPISPTEDRDLLLDLHWATGALLERNQQVAFGMYFLGWLDMDLPGVIEYKPGENFFPVTDPRFPNLAALRNYLSTTYVQSQVDALLAEERYVERNGKLYGDFSKDGGMGYFRDWSDFRFSILEMTGDTAKIAITISGVQPGDDEPTSEMVIATLVMVNRNWLLQSLVY